MECMGMASGCGEQEVGVASGCGEQEASVASGSGWNLWVWLLGVATGCGCKEVYRFPHTTYPYCSCICSFFIATSLLFVHLKKCFSFL